MNSQPSPKDINTNWNHTIAAGKWHSGQEPNKNEWYLAISNGASGSNPPQFAVQMGSTKITAAGTALPKGSWYHLVGVREGTRIMLYVDGVLQDTKHVGNGAINNIPARDILIDKMGNDIYHRAL